MPYQGQCLCGGCKIFVDAECLLKGLTICHCKDCIQSSGATFGVLVPTKNLRLEGSAKSHVLVNSISGNTVTRWFCENCGSHLYGSSSARPQYANVKAGNIEEYTKLPVIAEIFTKDRWPSIPAIPGALQREISFATDDARHLLKSDAGAQDESTETKS